MLNTSYMKVILQRLAYSFELSSHHYSPQTEFPFQQIGFTITALLEANYENLSFFSTGYATLRKL